MYHTRSLPLKRKFKKLVNTIQEKPSPIPLTLFVLTTLWLIAQGIYVYSIVRHIIAGEPTNEILFWPLTEIWQATILESGKFPIAHCIIASLPSLFIFFTLLINCNLYFHPWSNGSICGSKFWLSELIQRIIRFVIYASCFIYIILVYCKKEFVENTVFMFVSTIHVIPLFICILQSTFRLNFRRMINYVIAFSNVIVYLVLLDGACVGYKFLGLIGNSEARTEFAHIFADYSGVLGVGMLITIVAVILEESISNLLAAITSRHPANLSQRRRRNRRRLLTHWRYEKDGTVSSWEDSAVVMLGIEIAVFCITALLVLLWPGHSVAEADSIISESILGTITQATEAAQLVTADETLATLPLGMYPLSFAALLFIPAMMSTWTPSDEKLIQGEYTYLITKSTQLDPDDIRQSSNHWTDFCQVVVNLYTNVSGLESEDRSFHRLEDFFVQLRDYLGIDCTCANSKYFSDILSSKGNISAKLLREAAHEELDDEKSYHKRDSMIQRARDLQFASTFLTLMHNHWEKSKKNSISRPFEEQDPLSFIENLSDSFFDKRDHVWGQRFGAYNLSAHDGIKLLQMDTLIHILRRESNSHCGLAWLGCSCENHPTECNTSQLDLTTDEIHENHLPFIRNRMELMLTYPFIVIDCYKQRWNDQIDHFPLEDDIYVYYLNLIKQSGHFKQQFPRTKEGRKKLSNYDNFMVELVYGAYTYLVESMADTTLLKRVDDKLVELYDQIRGYGSNHPSRENWYDNFLGSWKHSTNILDTVKPTFISRLKIRASKQTAAVLPDLAEYQNLKASVTSMQNTIEAYEHDFQQKKSEYDMNSRMRTQEITDAEQELHKAKVGTSRHISRQNNLDCLRYHDHFMSSVEQQQLERIKSIAGQTKVRLAQDEFRLKEIDEHLKKQDDEVTDNIRRFIRPLLRIAYAVFNYPKGGSSS